MKKSFIEVMKEICEDEEISLQQLSKLLKVPQKELEEYQSGQKEPSLEVMAKFCKEFDQPMDYFLQDECNSIEQNLIIVTNKREKEAILDRTNGVYITPFLYDMVQINLSGYHLVAKIKRVSPELHMRQKTYEAVVSNNGEVKVFEDFSFVAYGRGFEYGCCPARSKKDNKCYMIDLNGEIKGKGYDNIVETCGFPKIDISGGFGLFLGINYKDNKEGQRIIENAELLYKGKVVPIKIFFTNYFDKNSEYKEGYRSIVAPELDTKEKALDAIIKYGVNMIEFLPKSFLESGDNMVVLLENIIKYESGRKDFNSEFYKKEIFYVLRNLKMFADWWKPKFELGGCQNVQHYLWSFFVDNMMKDESVANAVIEFIKEIGGIRE